MTGIAIGAVRTGRTLTGAMRESGLRWLAEAWGEHGPERHQLLAGWAHPSLGQEDRERVFLAYQKAHLDHKALLPGGGMHWTEWDPGLIAPGRDPQELAAELSAEQAAAELFALMHGLRER